MVWGRCSLRDKKNLLIHLPIASYFRGKISARYQLFTTIHVQIIEVEASALQRTEAILSLLKRGKIKRRLDF